MNSMSTGEEESGRQRFRQIRTSQNQFVYADVELKFANKFEDGIGVREYKLIMMSAIDTLFGEVGAKIQFDILKFREEDCRAYIRVVARDYVQFRLSLTLLSQWKEKSCHFVFHKPITLRFGFTSNPGEQVCHSLASLPVMASLADNIVTQVE